MNRADENEDKFDHDPLGTGCLTPQFVGVPVCAHLVDTYKVLQADGQHVRDEWRCRNCGTTFLPVDAIQSVLLDAERLRSEALTTENRDQVEAIAALNARVEALERENADRLRALFYLRHIS